MTQTRKLKKNGWKCCLSLQGILDPENNDINKEQQELPNFMIYMLLPDRHNLCIFSTFIRIVSAALLQYLMAFS
jgi:hypothetical protein